MNPSRLFSWLRSLTQEDQGGPPLPSWATLVPTNANKAQIIRVDAEAAYTAILGELHEDDGTMIGSARYKYKGPPDAYWLQVAKHFITLDLQAAMGKFRIEIHIKDPTQNIVWVTPEGGGGPNYPNM